MSPLTRRSALCLCLAAMAGCGRFGSGGRDRSGGDLNPGETPELRHLINRYADLYDMPPSLIHRVIQRESGYRANARNGPY